jgi:hypothetical protein
MVSGDETLKSSLKLSQTELGKKLETSAMVVSRWERGGSTSGRWVHSVGEVGGRSALLVLLGPSRVEYC